MRFKFLIAVCARSSEAPIDGLVLDDMPCQRNIASMSIVDVIEATNRKCQVLIRKYSLRYIGNIVALWANKLVRENCLIWEWSLQN